MEIELSPSRQNLLQEQQQHQDNNDDDDSPLLASCNYNTVTTTNTTTSSTAATSINSSIRNGGNINKPPSSRKTKTSHAAAEAKNKTQEFQSADWIFSIPFRKICLAHPPQEAIEVPHVSSGDTEPSTDTATVTTVAKGKFKGWKFASKFTNWSLESQSILTVTYVPSIHAIPSYTNKSVGVDYVQRMFKRAKCVKSCFKKTKVYMEKYDAEDIVRVKYLKKDHVKIRGLQDCCGGVQIVLRRKFDTDTRFPNSYSGGGGGGSSSGVEGQKGKIPFDGLEILKTHGYVSTNDDDDDDNDEGDNDIMQDEIDEEEDGEEEPYGAIVTFVLFNLSHEDQVEMSCTTSTNKQSKMLAPPLLWKVQMPPDPSIALEAMTVLDGSLNVHPPDYDDGDDDDDDDDLGGCRLGTFRGQVDNINDDSNGNTNNNNDESESDSYSSDVSCTASHPTNIYINGYQSWSFTGSVTQGDEQPKSAMPEFLSKAFNYGADIPPPVYRDEQDAADDEEEEWVGNEGSGVGGGGTEPLMRRSGGYVRTCPKDGSETCNFQKLTDYKSDFFTCVSCMDKEDCLNHDIEEILGDSPIQNCILDEHGGPAIVLGFLSQRCQYGLITFDSDLCCVAMHASFQRTIASKSKGITTDWAYCQILPGGFYDEEPMAFYLNAVSAYNGARPFENFPPLTGWCSWYHYYENIDSESLNSNFTRLKDLNSTITSDAVIIDDGYITAWGDWDSLKPKNFPKIKGGMKHLADEIRRNGMTPGLWIAPFACDKHSKLAKEHPDWIIRNDEGRFANSSNCGKFFYGLDATNPAVREYAFKCIRRAVKEWGFRVLKLDFLYAACLQGNGKYDITMTRAETMHLALQTLRAAAGPDTFIIGCGCPIGPAIGLVDANRVSADTGPTWYPDFPLPWWDHGTLPSLRAMVRNTVTRSSLGHRFWHNDPDCILLGNTTRLTKVEITSAATVIAMTGGMLLLSDDLSKLENDRLQIATRIYPVTGITAVSLDLHNTSKSGVPCIMRMWCTDMMEMEIGGISSTQLTTANSKRTSFVPNEPWRNPWKRQRNCLPVAKGLGTWSLVSLSNWLDEPTVVSIPIEATLPPKEHVISKDQLHLGYHVFSFWSEKYHWVAADQAYETISKSLEPHQSEIFHVKPMSLDQCQYIGSDLHFTCGFEVEEFSSTAESVQLKLRSTLKRSGLIYLYIPCYAEKLTITCNGKSSEKVEVIFRTPKLWHNQTFYSGQVIRIWTKINADGSESDGRITVQVVEDD